MRALLFVRRWRSLLALGAAAALIAGAGGCGAAEGELDPEELSARDLLGLDAHVALGFGAAQRASAHRVLDAALAAPVDGSAFAVTAGGEATLAALVHGALVRTDVERARRGAAPLVLVRIEQESPDVWVQPLRTQRTELGATKAAAAPAAATTATTASGWDGELAPLPARGAGLLGQLAAVAGRDPAADTTLLVQPAPRAPFAAAYVPSADLLLVNPVLLAALEPLPGEAATLTAEGAAAATPAAAVPVVATPGAQAVVAAAAASAKTGSLGNPYAFYGSLGECSAAQLERCEACLPTTSCTAVTRDASDGNAECTTLAGGGGRGYYELCLNVALAIETVSSCVEGRVAAGTCPQVFVGNQLASLATNDAFLDDAACVEALDACLAEIYGAPSSPFPTGPDAGTGTPPPAPRDVDVSCGDCSNDASCSFSPQCDPQCDSSCQGGSCGDCSRGDGTGSGGSSGGGCGSCDSGGSSGSSGGDCSTCDSSSGSSSSCDSTCDSSSSSSSEGSSCGSCDSGGASSGGSSCGSSCDKSGSSGSGSSGCSTAGRAPGVRAAVNLVSVGWACLPLVVLFAWRRRELRRLRARREGGAS